MPFFCLQDPGYIKPSLKQSFKFRVRWNPKEEKEQIFRMLITNLSQILLKPLP